MIKYLRIICAVLTLGCLAASVTACATHDLTPTAEEESERPMLSSDPDLPTHQAD